MGAKDRVDTWMVSTMPSSDYLGAMSLGRREGIVPSSKASEGSDLGVRLMHLARDLGRRAFLRRTSRALAFYPMPNSSRMDRGSAVNLS